MKTYSKTEQISRLKTAFFQEIDKERSLKTLDPEKINDFADKLGGIVREDIATSQLRKVYNEIKKIQRSVKKSRILDKKSLAILEPRLAFAAARKHELKPVFELFEKCIPKINDGEDLDKLVYIMEALIAYHKYHGVRQMSRGERT